MYANDYSWVPTYLAGFVALAALGGLIIASIRSDTARSRLFVAWLLVPVLLAIGLGVVGAALGRNFGPYSPILFVPIFAASISIPWIIAAWPVYAFARFILARARRGRSTD